MQNLEHFDLCFFLTDERVLYIWILNVGKACIIEPIILILELQMHVSKVQYIISNHQPHKFNLYLKCFCCLFFVLSCLFAPLFLVQILKLVFCAH